MTLIEASGTLSEEKKKELRTPLSELIAFVEGMWREKDLPSSKNLHEVTDDTATL
jgi:hypothetical protein